MARRTISQEVKTAVLEGLKNGVKPAELALTHGLSLPTIYNYRKLLVVAPVVEAPVEG